MFSETDIDFVDEKLELNLSLLLEHKEYLEINNELSKINSELVSTLNEKQEKLFRDYQRISLDVTSYHNCLSYYVALNSKLKINKLK